MADSSQLSNYSSQLATLWFEKPFSEISEAREDEEIDLELGFLSQVSGQLEIRKMFDGMLPKYLELLQILVKRTKKKEFYY